MSPITIRLIRKLNNTRNGPDDDVIIIKRSDNNLLVKYKDRHHCETTQKLLLTTVALSDYIKNLGIMFLADMEPFEAIQFCFPGFPIFLANRESLSNTDTQDMLMDTAYIVSESMLSDVVRPQPDYGYSYNFTY